MLSLEKKLAIREPGLEDRARCIATTVLKAVSKYPEQKQIAIKPGWIHYRDK